MIRSFLAVELPDELRNGIAALQDELRQRLNHGVGKYARIQWVQISSIHLTMKFLGDIEEELVEPIHGAITDAVCALEGTDLLLSRLGCFPHIRAPRVLWVGSSGNKETGELPVADLHRAIEECMPRFGFARETKEFTPHLTLARVKEGERQVGAALTKSGILDRPITLSALPVRSVALMKSDLRPTGAVYTRLWEVKIGRQ